jgi:4-hydroxy-tetrahydrodipicolinate reductase
MSGAGSGPALALIGMGKMGRAVRELARDRGWPVCAELTRREGPVTAARLQGADVAIEFTTPDTALANITACLEAGCPVVSGTTGWASPDLPALVERTRGALLHDANFSVGAHLFLAVAQQAARWAREIGGYDEQVIEMHHAAKRDAPSGTARRLIERIGAPGSVPVTSIRIGHVPGTHTLVCDGLFDQLRVEHVVRDRRVFADGALTAAAWLVGKRGVFTMDDILERLA